MPRRPTDDEIRGALTLRPMASLRRGEGSNVWLHTTGLHDTGIIFQYNGHDVGWLSAKEVAEIAILLSRKAGQ